MGYRLDCFQQSDDTAGLRMWRRGELVASFGNRNHMPVCHEVEIEGREFFADTATVKAIIEHIIRAVRDDADATTDPDGGCMTVTIDGCVFDLNWQCQNRREFVPFLEELAAVYPRFKQLLTVLVDGQEHVCSDMTEDQIDRILAGDVVVPVG